MCGGACKCGGSRQGTCARAASTSGAPAHEAALASLVPDRAAYDKAVKALAKQGTTGFAAPKSVASRSLDSKLDLWDSRSEQALQWVLAFADAHAEEILTVARARHITGHHVFGDGEMYEYSRGRLAKEVIEELADAINYAVRRLSI